MKVGQLFIFIFSLFATINALADQAAGDEDKKKDTTQTSIWVTITTKGQTTVIQTIYSQSFMSTHTETDHADVKSGKVGLASSATKSAGGIRSYDRTTISQPNHAGQAGLYSGLFGAAVLAVGLL